MSREFLRKQIQTMEIPTPKELNSNNPTKFRHSSCWNEQKKKHKRKQISEFDTPTEFQLKRILCETSKWSPFLHRNFRLQGKSAAHPQQSILNTGKKVSVQTKMASSTISCDARSYMCVSKMGRERSVCLVHLSYATNF